MSRPGWAMIELPHALYSLHEPPISVHVYLLHKEVYSSCAFLQGTTSSLEMLPVRSAVGANLFWTGRSKSVSCTFVLSRLNLSFHAFFQEPSPLEHWPHVFSLGQAAQLDKRPKLLRCIKPLLTAVDASFPTHLSLVKGEIAA